MESEHLLFSQARIRPKSLFHNPNESTTNASDSDTISNSKAQKIHKFCEEPHFDGIPKYLKTIAKVSPIEDSFYICIGFGLIEALIRCKDQPRGLFCIKNFNSAIRKIEEKRVSILNQEIEIAKDILTELINRLFSQDISKAQALELLYEYANNRSSKAVYSIGVLMRCMSQNIGDNTQIDLCSNWYESFPTSEFAKIFGLIIYEPNPVYLLPADAHLIPLVHVFYNKAKNSYSLAYHKKHNELLLGNEADLNKFPFVYNKYECFLLERKHFRLEPFSSHFVCSAGIFPEKESLFVCIGIGVWESIICADKEKYSEKTITSFNELFAEENLIILRQEFGNDAEIAILGWLILKRMWSSANKSNSLREFHEKMRSNEYNSAYIIGMIVKCIIYLSVYREAGPFSSR